MKKKKNRFLLWCFSLIPGAGQMYLGFMKMGLSLLSFFVLGIMFASWTGLGILAFIPIVTWAYSFFLANNLGSMSDEEFARVEDRYLLGIDEKELKSAKDAMTGKYRKGAALLLIVLGISLLWNVMCDILYDILGKDFYWMYIGRYLRIVGNTAPRLIFGLVVIWIGMKLIQGKKKELEQMENVEERKTPTGTMSPDNMRQPETSWQNQQDIQQAAGQDTQASK